jgi:hypothetical protein
MVKPDTGQADIETYPSIAIQAYYTPKKKKIVLDIDDIILPEYVFRIQYYIH